MSSPVDEIELTPEQKRRIADAAERAGRTWSEVLESALRSYVDKSVAHRKDFGTKSFYDVLMEDGAVRLLEDGPPDLSTNPKYLEDLGRD
jgi:hypothetical protein